MGTPPQLAQGTTKSLYWPASEAIDDLIEVDLLVYVIYHDLLRSDVWGAMWHVL